MDDVAHPEAVVVVAAGARGAPGVPVQGHAGVRTPRTAGVVT